MVFDWLEEHIAPTHNCNVIQNTWDALHKVRVPQQRKIRPWFLRSNQASLYKLSIEVDGILKGFFFPTIPLCLGYETSNQHYMVIKPISMLQPLSS